MNNEIEWNKTKQKLIEIFLFKKKYHFGMIRLWNKKITINFPFFSTNPSFIINKAMIISNTTETGKTFIQCDQIHIQRPTKQTLQKTGKIDSDSMKNNLFCFF